MKSKKKIFNELTMFTSNRFVNDYLSENKELDSEILWEAS